MSYGPKQTLEQGYSKFVIKNYDSCWGWSGCCPTPGYGQFRTNGRLERAHRASWIINFGEIPEGMHVLHKCDNRICSNPDHLFLGTNLDNIKDMVSKNRHPTLNKHGELNHKSKLKYEDIYGIRNLISAGLSQLKIARMYNVCQMTICLIANNKIWRGAR